MKKSAIRTAGLLLALTTLLLPCLSCKNKNAAATATTAAAGTKVKASAIKTIAVKAEGGKATFDSMMEFFKPDYTPQTPDEIVNAGEQTATQKKSKKEKESTSVIQKIRNLSEYKIKYSKERKTFITYTPKQETIDDEKFKGKALTVEDWGPKKSVVSEAKFPSFYVIFSQPVRSLTALDAPSSTSEYISITPQLKGTFHWYGTQHISFEAEEAADPSVVYTIQVRPNVKSIYGNSIQGQTTFTTQAEPVKLKYIWGGYIKETLVDYDNTTGALPAHENRVLVRTNYLLKADSLADKLVIKAGDRTYTKSEISVEADFSNKSFSWWNNEPECNKDNGTTNTFIVTINAAVPHNSKIELSTTDDTKTYSYKTLQPFDRVRINDYTDYTDGNMGNPLRVTFTQVPDEQSVLDYITVHDKDDNVMTLTKDNIVINGRYLTIHSLPLELDTEYKLYIRAGFKDVYGQIYCNGDYTYYYFFKTRPVKAYVNYLDYGARMLEAQYPHKIIYEHQNVLDSSFYKIGTVENPLYTDTKYIMLSDDPQIFINDNVKNQRHFEEIDLDKYLNNGYGFVRFYADTQYKDIDYWDGEEITKSDKDILTIQVTDLGITTRMGINRAVVMVRSLSTNQPVPDADVYILDECSKKTDDPLNHIIAQGKTDKDGLAIINYTEEQIVAYENNKDYEYSYQDNLTVYVAKGDDKAVFTPTSHNTWRDGVSTGSRRDARKAIQRTFMFVDRGVYRPGETVTFRGIDKDQILGALMVHNGSYTINVEEGWWNGDKITDEIAGTLSESGGFWGSFKIPDDCEPGYYTIKYHRDGAGEYDVQRIQFQIAEFERVKTAASITVPEITYYSGDTLTAELSAEYLAGGALSGAEYKTTWYKQAFDITFETPETKGYTFGTDQYSYRTYYSDAKGKLNAEGKASLSCNSEKITDGSAYTYRVESSVTDVSNQRISTAASVIVHPAKFYIGVKKPLNSSGFLKTKTKAEFPYILTDISGNSLENAAGKVATLSYKLTREEWTMIHEQSVDNTLYTRYERQEIEEASGTISVGSAATGKLAITPENSGWYTLTLTGTDKNDGTVITTYGFYVTGGDSYRYNNYNSESISLTPEQSQYNPGDKAQILMESPLPAGDYLITVEREGIFSEEVRHFDSPANVIEVPVASNFVPVFYVAVSSYSVRQGEPTHQYGEPDLDKPKGYFGVTPVFVNPYVRAFSVAVETDKPSYKPGETATITLTATKGGKPLSNAELTVMAVDRGVLDVINYHVQNPIEYFYDRYNFPLRVRGGDSRAMLMDPVTYSVKDLQGGDEDEEKEEDERKDFRPTAVFEPVVMTDKNGKATVTFKVPDSLTTYRITAFGVKDDLFSLKEDEFTVQNPINVQQVQPRKLRERDTAECGVLITNLDAKGHDVTVTLETRTPTKNTNQDEREGRITVPGEAFVDGDATAKVYVAPGDSSVVYFNVGATKEGTVELVYTVRSDILNEKLNSPIKIEKTYTYETVATLGTISNEQDAASAKELLTIPGFAKDGRGDLSFTIDATRLGMLGGAVNYLFDYPYGCLEQQSSRVLPLIAFGEYIDVFGLNSKIADTEKLVKSYISSWGNYQLSNGGFPYWPGGEYGSLYVSLRMAYIYALGLERGYKAEDFGYDIDKLMSYIRDFLYKHGDIAYDYERAYACYIQVLLGKQEMNHILDGLYAKRSDLSLSTNALIALAYYSDGDTSRAGKIADEIKTYLQIDGRTVTVLNKTRSNMWEWYNSNSEEMALILQLLCTINPQDQMVDKLIYTLLQNQSHGYWQNTATTSRVLEAIYAYIKGRKLDETNYTAVVSVEGTKLLSGSFNGAAAKPKTLKLPFEDELIAGLPKDTSAEVSFQKNGQGNLYYTMEMRYAMPDEYLTARDEGLKVEYTIIDSETGEVVNKGNSTDCLLNLTSGKIYKASIKLESHKSRDYVALRAPIPSGAEILDSSLVTTGTVDDAYEYSWGHWLSNKTIRDNEIQFFWDSFSSGTTTVNFTFRAARRGIYPVPPVQAECMYEGETFGRSDGYLCIIE
ncbi:MAG: alpha-2-macroglobulin [Treponema sp.]|nr:alpha-2-macroglobulin [Treponema sp.]